MTFPGGYHGAYLHVDLSSGEACRVPLRADTLRRYVGGVGLGTRLLLQTAPPGVDPLSPEAPLVFAFSPLVGTPLTTSAKFAVVCKSPLTGRINDALSSSHFALAAKGLGIDALVLTGARAEWSTLILDGDGVSFHGAEGLLGRSAGDTEAELKRRIEDGRGSFQTAAIGPAGENRVAFATLSNGGRHAGRGGTGAVLGAKRLKALAVRGARRVALADPEGVVKQARDLSRRSLGPATEKYRELGTAANLVTFNRLAVLPARNFQQSTFQGAAALDPAALEKAQGKARTSCAACTIGCEHIYGGQDGQSGVRVEYESLFALGPLCGIDDGDAVLQGIRLCDALGLDTISAGATIAFAMECAERGWLPGSPDGPDARSLRFGNGDAVHDLLRRMAARADPLADLLAEGTRRAAGRIGNGAAAIAPHVKGLEIPGYEPRALQSMALGFAVGTRGADHNRSSAYEVDFSEAVDRMHGDGNSARLAAESEDRAALLDSLILCKFLRGVFDDLFDESAELLRSVTGWDVDAAELRATARRIVGARKVFNEREGWTPEEDTLPERFLQEPLTEGASAGATLTRDRLAGMVLAYYRARGWSADGRVSPDQRRDMQIEEPA